MLIQNGRLAGGPLSFIGGNALSCMADSRSRNGWSIANARAFGPEKSWPQGYNSPNAIRMPLKTGGNIAARFYGVSGFTASVTATGEIGATLTGVGTLSPNAQMGAAIYATMSGEGTMTAIVSALGNMAATLDAGARPSAFDVAQEVWQAQATSYNSAGTMGQKVNAAGAAGDPWSVQLEGTFTAADLLRLAAAVLAGDATDLGGASPAFKSLDGTKDRLVATQVAGVRTVATRDGTE